MNLDALLLTPTDQAGDLGPDGDLATLNIYAVNNEMAALRAKIDQGTMKQEDWRRALALLRSQRGLAASSTPKSGSRAKTPKAAKLSGDDLLKELE